MKKVSFCLAFAVFIVFLSCDNEPIDGAFFNDNGGEGNNTTPTCQEATQATADASLALVNSTTDTYVALCNDFASALQAQINACGDSSGVLQATLDALDCSSNSNDDCANAILVTQAAQSALANASTENYSTLCNSYAAALQMQINACGDDTGELQGIIDGLNCENNNNLLLPSQIIETYEDGSTIVINLTYQGNRLVNEEITYNYVGEAIEIDINDYTYENDLLVRIDNTFTGPTGSNESNYSIFEYNSDNQLISETIYFTENGQIVNTQADTYVHNSDGTITFTEGSEEVHILTFQNGNLVYSEHTNGDHDYTYSYDDKNSAFKNIYVREIVGLYSFESGNNNLLTTENTGGAINTDNLNITYTYNSDNYPVTSTTIVNQGTSGEETYTTEYFYN